MALSFDVDESDGLVRLAAGSKPGVSEWFALMEAVAADARYRHGFDFIYDRTGVTDVPSATDVRTWIARHARMMRETGNGRLAIVVRQPVVYGMMRMASAFAETEGVLLAVFWSEREALTWLGRGSARDGG